MQTTSGFVQTNEIKIHYERIDSDNPAFVLCHGVTDNGRCMLRLADHLADRFDVIMVDARGHGLSDKPSQGYSADHHADDLHGLVHALGLENPIFYGHSMGARTVSRLAAKYPDLPRAVILEDPVFIIPLSKEESAAIDLFIRQRLDEIRGWKTMTEAELLQLAKEQGHPDWTPEGEIEWARAKKQVSPNVYNMNNSMETIRDDFLQITCPVLILKADADAETLAKNQAAAALIPKGKIIHVAGTGHNIRRDDFNAVTNYLDAFLESLP